MNQHPEQMFFRCKLFFRFFANCFCTHEDHFGQFRYLSPTPPIIFNWREIPYINWHLNPLCSSAIFHDPYYSIIKGLKVSNWTRIWPSCSSALFWNQKINVMPRSIKKWNCLTLAHFARLVLSLQIKTLQIATTLNELKYNDLLTLLNNIGSS